MGTKKEFYRFRDGITPLNEEEFNKRFFDVDLRISPIEDQKPAYDKALEDLEKAQIDLAEAKEKLSLFEGNSIQAQEIVSSLEANVSNLLATVAQLQIQEGLHPWVNAGDFGAIGDGVEDDTEAIQAAIDSLGTGAGTLLLPGICKTGALTFPNSTTWWNILLEKGLILTESLYLTPQYISIKGIGSNTTLQFQTAPTATIIGPSSGSTFIRQGSSGGLRLENIYILATNTDTALLLQAAANAFLKNVGIASGGIPITQDDFFWLWIEDSILGTMAGAYSLYITNSGPAGGPGQSGLTYIYDTRITGKGIGIEAQEAMAGIGSLYVDGLTYELAGNPFLTLDSEFAPIALIDLKNVIIADQSSLGSLIKVESTSPVGTITDVNIENLNFPYNLPLVDSPFDIKGKINSSSFGSSTGLGWKVGDHQYEGIIERHGFSYNRRFPARKIGNSPVLIPYDILAVNQDVTTWTINTDLGTGTLTTGIEAPDGSMTAAKLTATTGTPRILLYGLQISVAVGDWIIGAICMKPESATRGATPNVAVAFLIDGNYHFDTGNNAFPFKGDSVARVQQSWFSTVEAHQITQVGGANSHLYFSLRLDANYPTSFWMPSIFHIPASANLTEAEVKRIVRDISYLVSGAPKGAMAFAPWQKLYFGSDTYLQRLSAGALTINGNQIQAGAGMRVLAGSVETTDVSWTNNNSKNTAYTRNIPGGTLGTNKWIKVTVLGFASNTSGADRTIAVFLAYGSFEISGIIYSANGINTGIEVVGYICADGVTNAQDLILRAVNGYGSTGGAVGSNAVSGEASQDSATDKTLTVSLQAGVAHANFTLGFKHGFIEVAP